MRVAILLAGALCVAAADALAACRSCPELVAIPGEAFAMTVTEITFDQWAACVADRACKGGQDDHGWGRGKRPVINVSWDDANSYAAWLSGKLGRACRLPTEAEWENAARGGTRTPFWWGTDHGSGMANCRDCNPQPIYGTTPVGTFPPNPFGLRDMNGNVWEWVQDCWQNPAPDKGCTQRVIKGGSWYYYSQNASVPARAQNASSTGSYNVGVRIVCSP
jgi:formylglycine-generating enzyme required for sulfatase activity